MRIVLQRVKSASVTIGGEKKSEIGQGLLVLFGAEAGDNPERCRFMAEKVLSLRIFEDEGGRMNLSVRDIGGSVMVVSQFTLLADCKGGRRPSFTNAMPPSGAVTLYEEFLSLIKADSSLASTKSGEFGADMQVALINDGPVTIILDSKEVCPKL